MSKQRLVVGGDHAGFGMKQAVIDHLRSEGHVVEDAGTHSSESTDYPEYAHAVAEAVRLHEADLGIVVCGSGNGVNMAANKHPGVRAALAWTEEVATLARTHNDANVLSLPARFIDVPLALRIVDQFITSRFEGGRHERRVKKIEVGP